MRSSFSAGVMLAALLCLICSPVMAGMSAVGAEFGDASITLAAIGFGVVLTAKALREKRGAVYAKMKELADRSNDESHEWSGEDEQEWSRVNDEYNTLTRQIEKQERIEQLGGDPPEDRGGSGGSNPFERGQNPGDPGGMEINEARGLALRAWFRSQAGIELDEREQHACSMAGMNPHRRDLRLNLRSTHQIRAAQDLFRRTHPELLDQRAGLNVGTAAEGGYMVPEGFVNQLDQAMLYFGPMLQVAEIIRTDTGNDLPWPNSDDTGNTGEQLSEATGVGASVDPTIGSITWKAFKFSSKLVKASTELIEDSAFDIVEYLSGVLGERLGRIQNTKYTTGAGGGTTPGGIVTEATLGVTAAGAAAITADELIDLEHSVDRAYRTGAAYMMHDNVLLYVRKLKDSNGQYLFQSNLREGGPDTINGRPLWINNDMASAIATTAKTVLFGQLSKYKVRQVKEIRMRRLVERYADTDEEGFIAFIRADGHLADAGVAPVKFLQQA